MTEQEPRIAAPLEPMRILCSVDCDGWDEEFIFGLNVIEIEGHDQGQIWNNTMHIEFIELSTFEALQKRCEEKDETNQKLRFSWLEVQREKLELQSKLGEQAAEIERLGKEKIVPHDTFWNKIESDNQIKSLTEQNSILRGGLEFYANKENWGGAHFHTMNKVVMLKGEDVEFEMPSHPFTDKYAGLVAREAIIKADKVKGE